MKEICPSQICTGCGLCASLCPKKCIKILPQKMGHLYPYVDQDSCVNCGLCQNSCPSVNEKEKKYPLTAYAAWAKDINDYTTSTSGGVSAIISQYIISQGGIVYGCEMKPGIEVKHIRIDKKNDLYRIKGSKYVQSSVVDCYQKIRDDVKTGRKTLFLGTPCQCAAVKNLFKDVPLNLYLVDLICHGVPSLDVLKKHVSKITNITDKTKVIFREGNYQYLCKIVEDGKVVYSRCLQTERYKDFFINAFFDGYLSRESCSTCKYAQPNRCSDITIGDFWGLGKRFSVEEIPSHDYGCSVVLPVTKKGQQLVDAISPMLNIYERKVEEAVDGNTQLKCPLSFDDRIIKFRKYYTNIGSFAYYLMNLDRILLYFYKKIKCKLAFILKKEKR